MEPNIYMTLKNAIQILFICYTSSYNRMESLKMSFLNFSYNFLKKLSTNHFYHILLIIFFLISLFI